MIPAIFMPLCQGCNGAVEYPSGVLHPSKISPSSVFLIVAVFRCAAGGGVDPDTGRSPQEPPDNSDPVLVADSCFGLVCFWRSIRLKQYPRFARER